MPAPILWALAVGLAGLAGCRDNPFKENEDASPTDGATPEPPPTPDVSAEPDAQQNRYQPPENLSIPQPTNFGIFYHPYFVDEGEETPADLSDVKWLKPSNEKCWFASEQQLFSFSTNFETLANQYPVSRRLAADFSEEVDGVNTTIKDVLIDGVFIYALYGGANNGIAIRRVAEEDPEGGKTLPGFPLNLIGNEDLCCPERLLLSGNTLWVSAAKQNSDGNPGAGIVLGLERLTNGTLWLAGLGPIETTWQNPQGLAMIPIDNDGTYNKHLLSIETGPFTNAGNILGESGVDVITPIRGADQPLVSKIPLGEAAASAIFLDPDNFVAILSSPIRPHLYVLDLFRLDIDLANLMDSENPPFLTDVPLADATNPVRYLPPELENSSFAVDYHPESQTALASSFNGRLFHIQLPHTFTSEGVSLLPGFGAVGGHYFCNDSATQYCGPVAFLPEGGAVALTGQPVGVTYLPPERLEQN